MMKLEHSIFIAQTAQDYGAARGLIREYECWLGIDLSFQGFEAELASLSSMYGQPKGAMLLARSGGRPVGCVGLRDLGDGYCEMKRMFVLPEHQGKGIGSRLLDRFLEVADELGYRTVRLDSVRRLKRALGLYRRMGFQEIDAYCYAPELDAVFMQLELSEWRRRRRLISHCSEVHETSPRPPER